MGASWPAVKHEFNKPGFNDLWFNDLIFMTFTFNDPLIQQHLDSTTLGFNNKKSCIRETPTLSTDADSRTNTNLKRFRDLSIFFFLFFLQYVALLNMFLFCFSPPFFLPPPPPPSPPSRDLKKKKILSPTIQLCWSSKSHSIKLKVWTLTSLGKASQNKTIDSVIMIIPGSIVTK